MAAPETVAREALMRVINDEWATEGYVAVADHLHESLGEKGVRIGVSPERAIPYPSNTYVYDTELLVQFYGKWEKVADPTQTVDPTWIETQAERFRTALRTRNSDPNTGQVWYFNLGRLEYIKDPTGNKTRFEAYVTARGNNSALIETQ